MEGARAKIGLCFQNAEVISVAFGSSPPEGGGVAWLQLMAGTVMEMGVMPGRAESCALLRWW